VDDPSAKDLLTSEQVVRTAKAREA